MKLDLSVQLGTQGILDFRNVLINFEKEINRSINSIRYYKESLDINKLLSLKIWLSSITKCYPDCLNHRKLLLDITSNPNIFAAVEKIEEILLFLACVGNLAKKVYNDSNCMISVKNFFTEIEIKYNQVKAAQEHEKLLQESKRLTEQLIEKENKICMENRRIAIECEKASMESQRLAEEAEKLRKKNIEREKEKEKRIKEEQLKAERIKQLEIEQKKKHDEEVKRIQRIQRPVVYRSSREFHCMIS